MKVTLLPGTIAHSAFRVQSLCEELGIKCPVKDFNKQELELIMRYLEGLKHQWDNRPEIMKDFSIKR